jgi:hypothetical protein
MIVGGLAGQHGCAGSWQGQRLHKQALRDPASGVNNAVNARLFDLNDL